MARLLRRPRATVTVHVVPVVPRLSSGQHWGGWLVPCKSMCWRIGFNWTIRGFKVLLESSNCPNCNGDICQNPTQWKWCVPQEVFREQPEVVVVVVDVVSGASGNSAPLLADWNPLLASKWSYHWWFAQKVFICMFHKYPTSCFGCSHLMRCYLCSKSHQDMPIISSTASDMGTALDALSDVRLKLATSTWPVRISDIRGTWPEQWTPIIWFAMFGIKLKWACRTSTLLAWHASSCSFFEQNQKSSLEA